MSLCYTKFLMYPLILCALSLHKGRHPVQEVFLFAFEQWCNQVFCGEARMSGRGGDLAKRFT